MSGSDRRKYLTATVLDQALLDWCADNEDNRIEAVIEIEYPVESKLDIITILTKVTGHVYTVTVDGTPFSYTALAGDTTTTIATGLAAQFPDNGTAGAIPVGPQLTLTGNVPGVIYPVSIGGDANMSITLSGTTHALIYASDRHKYIVTDGVGVFYRAMLVFPEIIRTLGEWLVPELEFSTLQVEHSNANQKFNIFLIGGQHYAPFVNRQVTAKIGLAEIGSSYASLFRGVVTEAAGSARSTRSFKLVARDLNAAYDVQFPNTSIDPVAFPFVEDSISGKLLQVIYGDWTVELEADPNLDGGGPSGDVEAFPVNGNDPAVIGAPRNNVKVLIADHDLLLLDTTQVYLKRGGNTYLVPASDVVNVTVGNRGFEVLQDSGLTWVGGAQFEFGQGDIFAVRVKGYNLGIYTENIVAQALHLLETYGGVPGGMFHPNWLNYRDKAAPAQSAIVGFRSRICEGEAAGAVAYARSLLAQVRLEAFFDRDNLLKINSLHFEDWPAPTATAIRIENRDVEKDTFEPEIDEKNNFNRAQGFYKRSPTTKSQTRQTRIQVNNAAVTQIGGKQISKHIDFPNLIDESIVKMQVVEILRLASSTIEIISLTSTWRMILRDLGEFATISISIGSIQLSEVPAMIRQISYNPAGFKLPLRLWALAMCPYPAYTPGYAGTVGGYNATIDEE